MGAQFAWFTIVFLFAAGLSITGLCVLCDIGRRIAIANERIAVALESRSKPEVPNQIETAIRGLTLTREQADSVIELVNRCVKP
jgi:hypothetical protein